MKLTEINVYPIKSLAGISFTEARIESRGLEYDRRWMLVDENDKCLTQREFPKMATLGVTILDGGLRIEDGGETLEIPLFPAESEARDVEIWDDECRAAFYGPHVDEWFADALGARVRLVRMPEETRRFVPEDYAVRPDDHVSFADGYPFLLIGQSSLDMLNAKLAEPVPMNRFRPNFVVEGSAPFAEDGWKRFRIGAAVFHGVKPCGRCVMTTIDQQAGEKTGVEPLRTLGTFRKWNQKILFGENLIAENAGGILRVGDEVEVLETKRPPQF